MGLTKQSTGSGARSELFQVETQSDQDRIIALAGNPNTGKSSLFNRLTGLNQHTGNWPGKTVTNAQGTYIYQDQRYVLVDLPGTYSLLSNSADEQAARDFICFGQPHVTVVVVDATCLERNLNLVLQILEITSKVVVCVNLLDEARKKSLTIHLEKLSSLLGVPVVGTSARNGQGLDELKETIRQVAWGQLCPEPRPISYSHQLESLLAELTPLVQASLGEQVNSRWAALRLLDGSGFSLPGREQPLEAEISHDSHKTVNSAVLHPPLENLPWHTGQPPADVLEGHQLLQEQLAQASAQLEKDSLDQKQLQEEIVSQLIHTAERIGQDVVHVENRHYNKRDRDVDRILTSRIFGIPIMLGLLGLIFWLTIVGANYPSALLSSLFTSLEQPLYSFLTWAHLPGWTCDLLVQGMYRTLTWVVAVMLPPMAIFFPLFTLLEDLGYLPRVAFNLDHCFKKACAHGKQSLCMCMGFGCNAAGIVSCRIIDSPRERLIAIITNNFVPCNGRLPLLIALSGLFLASGVGHFRSLAAALAVVLVILLGVTLTLLLSRLLSKTILKGLPSSFTLELPPYRRPQIASILVRSILDRTLFVLARAVVVAAPAGLVIWGMANLTWGNASLLAHCAAGLDPLASLMGLDGYILLAFILALPANEIVLPILIMSYMATGSMAQPESLNAMKELFVQNGWTWLTAVCVMLFSLNHWPCATTLLTIRKETQSWKWTAVAFLVPTLTGMALCFLVAQSVRLLGLA